MTINKKVEQVRLSLGPVGRLDTGTAPELEREVQSSLDGIEELVLDLTELDYVSSAGLRVILKAHKLMHGNLRVIGANETVMEIFEITGFTDILTIE